MRRGEIVSKDAKETMKAGRVSVWRGICDTLREEITRGAIKGGDRLPTDVELAQRFGCNKHTARRAVAHLEQEGLVRVEWGRGTFVVEGSGHGQAPQARLLQTVLDQHLDLRKKILHIDSIAADAKVARALRVSIGSNCLCVVLLNEVADIPQSLDFNYFPLKRLPKLVTPAGNLVSGQITSAAALLKLAAVESYSRSRINIGARLPSVDEAAQLRIARQQPLLETENVHVDEDGHPVLYARTCFRADRLQLIVPVM